MSFFTALRFLTIIPKPFRGESGAGDIGRSLSYFPVVGLVIGAILAGLYWILSLFLPAAIIPGLLLAAEVIITGGLHLDGFADTCDGLAGHRTAEERLGIMRDSRVGAFAVIGVCLLLVIKYLSLVNVPESLMPATLVLMPVIGRWAMVYAVVGFPYARPSGLGKAFKQQSGWSSFEKATVITLGLSLVLIWLAPVTYIYLTANFVLLIVWVVTLASAAFFKRKLGGLTGDTYGAVCEAAELVVLLAVLTLAHKQWFGVPG